jgi:hypothetical protein
MGYIVSILQKGFNSRFQLQVSAYMEMYCTKMSQSGISEDEQLNGRISGNMYAVTSRIFNLILNFTQID